jgi:O-antigen/teichoic acid export membrane protein
MQIKVQRWLRLLRSTFARNVATTFLTQVVSLVIGVANAAIVARWLGPQGKGSLALALLIPSTLALFLSGGIPAANVYFVGSRRLSVTQVTQNATLLALLGVVAGLILTALGLATGLLQRLAPSVPTSLILLATVGLPGAVVNSFFSAILQGMQRIRTVNVITFLQSILTLGLTTLLVIGLGWGINGAVVAAVGAALGVTILLAWQVWRASGRLRPHYDSAILRQTLAFGLRGYVGNLLQFFNYRLDLFIVGILLGPAAVGIYTAAVALAELLWHLPNAVSFVIFPKASASRTEDLNRLTPRIFALTLGITVVGGIFIALLGRQLIQTIYSDLFLPAYQPLLALLPGVILLGGGKVLTNEIAGRGYVHYNSVNAGLALVLTVIFDLLLIPRWGVLGASWASTIAYSAIFLTAVLFYRSVSRGGSRINQEQQP